MKALQEMGYRIPEDVSIVGFDDLTFSEISSPPLTTLRVEKREMGKMAVPPSGRTDRWDRYQHSHQNTGVSENNI